MTAEVIDILERTPHIEGKATCLHCRHLWHAVAPIGTLYFQCPSCSLNKGVFKAICAPETFYQCNCGCAHFMIDPQGAVCCVCGLTHQDW